MVSPAFGVMADIVEYVHDGVSDNRDLSSPGYFDGFVFDGTNIEDV